MTGKWNMIVDLALCVNCHNCVLATKDEHAGNSFEGYSAAQSGGGLDTIRIDKHVRGEGALAEVTYVPRMCNHCDDAPCMKADTRGAISKRADGIVLIDPERAKGLQELPGACPYGMIVWDSETQIPHIWNFDPHLLDSGWSEPRCSHACPTGALRAVKCSDDEMQAMIAAEGLTTVASAGQAKPRVHYRNAYRLDSNLIAGSVTAREGGGQIECAADVRVALLSGDEEIAATVTDAFGDFQFDRVAPDAGTVTLRLETSKGLKREIELDASRSHVLELTI